MSAPPRLSTSRQAALSLYWFAMQAQWTALLITLLPKQALMMSDEAHKGRTLGVIMLLGAFVSMLAAPLFGAWSDRVRIRWGRRKPFLVIGTVGNALGLLGLALLPTRSDTLVPYILLFLWVQLSSNVATAPYSALIPDVVPVEQRGSASGWMGLMSMLGNLTGGIIGLLMPKIGGIPGAYVGMAVILLIGMLGTVLLVREPEPPELEPFHWDGFLRGLLSPFKTPNFRWVFFTRLLIMLGLFTVQENLLFFFKDVTAGGQQPFVYFHFGSLAVNDAAGAVSCFMLALLLGAVAISLSAGGLSDRYGRKPLVYISGALHALVAFGMLLTGNFLAVVLMALVFGIAYGAYQAVDWALATDVLPSEADAAKDMGVWHVSLTLPQVIATPIAGFLLDHFSRVGHDTGHPTLGFTVIFSIAILYFALGTVFVSRVKGVR